MCFYTLINYTFFARVGQPELEKKTNKQTNKHAHYKPLTEIKNKKKSEANVISQNV